MKEGQLLAGKYRLRRIIGAGGMATVWEATHTFTDKRVAIKVLRPEVARTPESAARFMREARISARIDHPHVIEVLDVGQAEDASLFLVMELLTGESLDAALRKKPSSLTPVAAGRVLVDVARALAAAHAAGVVHRDLKPTNVFLHRGRDGSVTAKVLDFGVSKVRDDEAMHGLTVAGTVLGSPLYMSPEQAAGLPRIDGRTDVFAFGSILFEALTGERPYDASNFNALLVAVATRPPRSIDLIAPHLPEGLRALVRGCLEPSRESRIGTFDEVARRLELLLPELEGFRGPLPGLAPHPAYARYQPEPIDEAPAPGASASGAPWAHTNPPPPNGKNQRAFLIGGAVALVACGALAFALRHRPAAPVAAAAAPPAPTLGHLAVTAASGSCEVRVDGELRGRTPLEAIDLAPGEHGLECRPEKGTTRVARLQVEPGETTRYRFALDP